VPVSTAMPVAVDATWADAARASEPAVSPDGVLNEYSVNS